MENKSIHLSFQNKHVALLPHEFLRPVHNFLVWLLYQFARATATVITEVLTTVLANIKLIILATLSFWHEEILYCITDILPYLGCFQKVIRNVIQGCLKNWRSESKKSFDLLLCKGISNWKMLLYHTIAIQLTKNKIKYWHDT